MCVIIAIPKGQTISKEELKKCWWRNPDGAGIGFIKGNKIHYKKGYMKFDDFYNTNKKIINNTKIEKVIHFRLTSVGETNKQQTHPFFLTDINENFKILEYEGTTPIFFMNGTIRGIKKEKDINDTASFIKNVLRKSSLTHRNKTDARIISEITDSKWAIIDQEGITLIGDYSTVNGIKYSNLIHNIQTKTIKTYNYCNQKHECKTCYWELQYKFMEKRNDYDSYSDFIQKNKTLVG